MKGEEKRLGNLRTYLQILAGTAGILVAIGYISERFHQDVLGINVDISSGDFIYKGGMFFYNSFYAVLYGIGRCFEQLNWILPLVVFFTMLFLLKTDCQKKLSKYSVLWIMIFIVVLIQGAFIIQEYTKVLPGKNLLLIGEKKSYKQSLSLYGRLIFLSILYFVVCCQLYKWNKWIKNEKFYYWFTNLIMSFIGIAVVFQLLTIPLYYGGLSHPYEYPIAMMDYEAEKGKKETHILAILGEKYGRLVTYNYPDRNIMMLEKQNIGKIEMKGNKNIFDSQSYKQ